MTRIWCQVPQIPSFNNARKAFLQDALKVVKGAPFKKIQFSRWVNRMKQSNPNMCLNPEHAYYTKFPKPLPHELKSSNSTDSTGFEAKQEIVQGSSITIMSYNILCGNHMLSEPPMQFAQYYVWDTRMKRVYEHIMQHSPDIVCMQEVDVPGWWAEKLDKVGYTVVYHARTNLQNRASVDGCCIAFKRSMFRLVTHTAVRYCTHPSFVSRTQIGLAALLEKVSSISIRQNSAASRLIGDESPSAQPSRNFICVLTSHFLWNARRGEAKLAQIQTCLNGAALWLRALGTAAAMQGESDDTKESFTTLFNSDKLKRNYDFHLQLHKYQLPNCRDVDVSSVTTEESKFPQACANDVVMNVTGPCISNAKEEHCKIELPDLYANKVPFVPVLTKCGDKIAHDKLFPPMTVVTVVETASDAESTKKKETEYLNDLAKHLENYGGVPKNVLEHTAFVVCGDFNTTPTSHVSDFMRTSLIDVQTTYGDTEESIKQPKELPGFKRFQADAITSISSAMNAFIGGSNLKPKVVPYLKELLLSERNDLSKKSTDALLSILSKFDWTMPKMLIAYGTDLDGTEQTFEKWREWKGYRNGLPWMNPNQSLAQQALMVRKDRASKIKSTEPMDGESDFCEDAFGYPGLYLQGPEFKENAASLKKVTVVAPESSIITQILEEVKFTGDKKITDLAIAELSKPLPADAKQPKPKRNKLSEDGKLSANSRIVELSSAKHNYVEMPEQETGDNADEELKSIDIETAAKAIQTTLWMHQKPIPFENIKDTVLIPLSESDVYACVALAARHAATSIIERGLNLPFRETYVSKTEEKHVTRNNPRLSKSMLIDSSTIIASTTTTCHLECLHVRAPLFHPFVGLASAYQSPGLPLAYRCTGIQQPGRYQVDYIYYSPLSVARMLELDQFRAESLKNMAKYSLAHLTTIALSATTPSLLNRESESQELKEDSQVKTVGTGLRLDAILELPSDEVTFYPNFITPSFNHGSDHLSIMASFTIVPSSE